MEQGPADGAQKRHKAAKDTEGGAGSQPGDPPPPYQIPRSPSGNRGAAPPLPLPPLSPQSGPRMSADNTHRHSSISLPPAPRWGSGIVNSTRQPEAEAQLRQQGKHARVDGLWDPHVLGTLRPNPSQR